MDIKGQEVARKEMIIKERKVEPKKNHIPYFIIHNIISMILFFFFAWLAKLFDKRTDSIPDLFRDYYLPYYATVFFFLLISGILARVITYYLVLKPIYKRFYKRKRIADFWDLNVGINKLSFAYVISCIINAFFFTIGLYLIIQQEVLKSDTVLALIISYMIMKLATFILMKIARYIIIHAFTGLKL